MKRSIKNIICFTLIILMGIMMYLTMNYAKNHITVNNNFPNNMMGENSNEMGEPPEMNNNENNDMKENATGEPPEKPEGEMGEPPEKPEGDSVNNDSNIPEKPSGEANDMTPPSNENNNGEMMTPPDGKPGETNNKNNLTYVYYIVFGVETLIISVLIIHLIMSNLNKKTIKETYSNSDKIKIIVLSTIILTTILTYLSGIITNKYFIENTNNTPNMNNNTNISYSSQNEITTNETINNKEYSSSTKDENALLINGNIDVELSNIVVNKEGDSDGGDNTSFYGTNSAILAKDGANLTIKNATINTNATGANGVFSYGGSATTNNSNSDGTTINISDSEITTTKDNSGGIMTTGGGTMNATNLTITTSGTSSAAIRSDRGGGTVNVNKGTYTTNGQGSPSVYSTANITVKNAKLVSNASEGIVIEGKNSVTLDNVELIDNNTKLNGKSTTYKNIFLYQSMSGDASVGNSSFTASNSKITTKKGDSFYVTNTTATITLTNNEITNTDSEGNFLRIQKDSWGTSGKNGGDVTLILNNQNVEGNIVVDSISSLKMTMKDSSYFEGSINTDNESENITLTLDKTSKIKLTKDTYITSLENEDSTNCNIDLNGYKLYINGKSL